MPEIKCISPVDGSIYAARPVATGGQIGRALAAARKAQTSWRKRPVAERAEFCSAAVDAMLAMAGDIVPELAWQMGRPVRFGAGELGGLCFANEDCASDKQLSDCACLIDASEIRGQGRAVSGGNAFDINDVLDAQGDAE